MALVTLVCQNLVLQEAAMATGMVLEATLILVPRARLTVETSSTMEVRLQIQST